VCGGVCVCVWGGVCVCVCCVCVLCVCVCVCVCGVCVCVCVAFYGMQPAREAILCRQLWPATLSYIFPYYLIHGAIFGKK